MNKLTTNVEEKNKQSNVMNMLRVGPIMPFYLFINHKCRKVAAQSGSKAMLPTSYQ